MNYEYHIADVFTDKAFGGNQLAVIPDARGLTAEQMKSITREFNFSESIFVFPPDNPANTRKVRIFTPGSELPFAGHPTIGVAIVLAAIGELEVEGSYVRIVLEEGVGPVPVKITMRDGKPAFAQLTTAKLPERGPGSFDPRVVAGALSLEIKDLDIDEDLGIEGWSAGLPFIFVPLNSIDALRRARPKLDLFDKCFGSTWADSVFVFVENEESKARDGVMNGDGVIHARMFAPSFGIPEDSATGSACASLGGYLASRATIADGTLRYRVHQGVEMGRPSLLEGEIDVAHGELKAVRVGGSAVLFSSGTLSIL